MLGVVVNENNSHLLVLENRILLECAYADSMSRIGEFFQSKSEPWCKALVIMELASCILACEPPKAGACLLPAQTLMHIQLCFSYQYIFFRS